MKKFTILFMLTYIFYGDYSEAYPYKVKEYEDKGTVRLAFNHRYTNNVKEKIYSEEKKEFIDTIKDYYEMSWEEFVKNEKNGLYNLN